MRKISARLFMSVLEFSAWVNGLLFAMKMISILQTGLKVFLFEYISMKIAYQKVTSHRLKTLDDVTKARFI